MYLKCLTANASGEGSSNDGSKAPYNQNTTLSRDFRKEASNQTMPMYLSNLADVFGRKSRSLVTLKTVSLQLKEKT